MIPPASPRQPQCSIASPPGPESATGRQSATKTSGARPTSAVTWPSTSGPHACRVGERGRVLRCPVGGDLGAVDLAADHDPRRVDADGGGKPAAVLEHGEAVVVGEDAQVEALEGALADPAEAGREGGTRSRQLGFEPASSVPLSPLHQGDYDSVRAAASAAASSSSRPEISPSSLRRSAAASPAPTAGPGSTPAAIRSSPPISSTTDRQRAT